MQPSETEQGRPAFHRRHRNAILLVTLLLLILLHPINILFRDRALSDMVLMTIVMSASLNAISFGNRTVTRIAIVLAILAVISGWLEALYHSTQLEIVSDSLAAGLYIYIATYLFRGIIVEKEITMDQLFAAVVIYILIGLTWGNFYSMTDTISPGAIDFGSTSNQSDISNNYMFFSFVTLTTLGYGDMLPVSPFAKSLAILESVTGVMFVAILISRLVGKINTQE